MPTRTSWIYPPLVVAAGLGAYHLLSSGRPSTTLVEELRAEVADLREQVDAKAGPPPISDADLSKVNPALARRLLALESRIHALESAPAGRDPSPSGDGARLDLAAFRSLLAEVRRIEQAERDEQQALRILGRVNPPLSPDKAAQVAPLLGAWFGRMREAVRTDGSMAPEAVAARQREATLATSERDARLERILTPEELVAVRAALPLFPMPNPAPVPPGGANGPPPNGR